MNTVDFEDIDLKRMPFLKENKYAFDSYYFHQINKYKVNKIICCQFGHDNTIKASLFIAIDGMNAKIPYSAPFSMMEEYKLCSIEEVDEYIVELNQYFDNNKIKSVDIILPPLIYDQHRITKLVSAMMRNGYILTGLELSFAIITKDDDKYIDSLHRNAKKNLQNALCHDYSLTHCDDDESKYKAYEIIKINRTTNNYRLAMTWEQIKDTIEFIPHDFFILKLGEKAIASAVVFMVTEYAYQVVYWGDIPGYAYARPVNMLAYLLNHYYYEKNIRILDIGPSMLDGKPNYGLCRFKESIGCEISGKYILHRGGDEE